jgi:ABC-type Mn2+/Zn2+ transport system ATPase subunit
MAVLTIEGCAPRRQRRTLCVPMFGIVGPGDICWLRGDNQVGKSSFLLALMAHVECVGRLSGSAVRDGLVDASYAPQAHALQYAEHGAAVGSVGDVVALQFAEVETVVAASGLDQHINRPFTDLSPGKRQRLLAMMALHHPAPLMLLDEPVAGVDAAGRQAIWDALMTRLQAGAGAIVVSHEAPPIKPAAVWTLEALS